MLKQFFLLTIRLYQKIFSPETGWIGRRLYGRRVCIYIPTCSEYSYQAINRYGILKGTWLGMKRIVRCHPWAQGGYDPVPSRF